MPPSSGKLAASWMTANPWGTKNRMAPSTHNVMELGPAFAAVATHDIPRTATRLNRTRSRRLRRRSRFGELVGVILIGTSRRLQRARVAVWIRKTKAIPLTSRVGKSRTSAGLLMFRKAEAGLEVLLVHPGGPYFRNKDDGAWTISKGEAAEGEDLLTRAGTEFEEELGIPAPAAAGWIEVGSVKQKGGKTVHAWAFEGNLPDGF